MKDMEGRTDRRGDNTDNTNHTGSYQQGNTHKLRKPLKILGDKILHFISQKIRNEKEKEKKKKCRGKKLGKIKDKIFLKMCNSSCNSTIKIIRILFLGIK